MWYGKKKVRCKVCGYAITARANFFKLSAVERESTGPAFLTGLGITEIDAAIKKCSSLEHFLEKDKITVVEENRPPNRVLSQPTDPCTRKSKRVAAIFQQQ